ncbi:MAG: TetR family transcriptional regulator, partial [Nitrospiraceae bacterium]|nr:TetR family transcriptional regulator [Nitrospiraceae bacterium]
MATLTRKKREIQERDGLILKAARAMLLEIGYHGLTMARIATVIDSSKGTIYQHFPCKEDIIVALAIQSMEKQREMVERAATFRGRPRERMLAVGEATALFARLYVDDARIFQIMTGEAIMQKASPDTLWRLKVSGHNTANIMLGIVRDAIVQGDVELD